MKKRLIINVKGKVQNVGFRAFTSRRAGDFNVKGIVKNLPTGDVYVEAEGEEDQLEAFLGVIKKGPNWSRVEDVKVQEAPLNGYEDFRIS